MAASGDGILTRQGLISDEGLLLGGELHESVQVHSVLQCPMQRAEIPQGRRSRHTGRVRHGRQETDGCQSRGVTEAMGVWEGSGSPWWYDF